MALGTKTKSSQQYNYIAQNTSGEIVRGELKAINEDSVLQQLDRLDLDAISVNPIKESLWDKEITFFDRVPALAIYTFTRQLSVMLKAGVPLVDALNSMHGENTNPKLNKALHQVIEDVSGGQSLSNAMAKHPKLFNTMFVNIVKAGENTGVLDTVLLHWQNLSITIYN